MFYLHKYFYLYQYFYYRYLYLKKYVVFTLEKVEIYLEHPFI